MQAAIRCDAASPRLPIEAEAALRVIEVPMRRRSLAPGIPRGEKAALIDGPADGRGMAGQIR